jgi:hypothetical protein
VIALEDCPTVKRIVEATPIDDAGEALAKRPGGDGLGEFPTRPTRSADVEVSHLQALKNLDKLHSQSFACLRDAKIQPAITGAKLEAADSAGTAPFIRDVRLRANRHACRDADGCNVAERRTEWGECFYEAAEPALSNVQHAEPTTRIVKSALSGDAERRQSQRIWPTTNTVQRSSRRLRLDDRAQPFAMK